MEKAVQHYSTVSMFNYIWNTKKEDGFTDVVKAVNESSKSYGLLMDGIEEGLSKEEILRMKYSTFSTTKMKPAVFMEHLSSVLDEYSKNRMEYCSR